MSEPIKPAAMGSWGIQELAAGGPALGLNIAGGIAPVIAVAMVAYLAFNKIHENIQWNADLREFRQAATSRHQWLNVFIIMSGVLATATTIIKAVGAAIAIQSTGYLLGGIWLGMGCAVVLNHWVYQRSVSHDGSAVAR